MRVDPVYRGIIQLGRVLMKFQGLHVHVTGAEKIPRTGGAVLAFNHTGYMDFVYGGYAPWRSSRRLVRYMSKASIFNTTGVGWLMKAMGHIPVDRIDGSASFDEAVSLAAEGQLVGIFPEATISRSFEIKNLRTGAVRIAHAAGVPVIPILMFGSQRIWTKGGKRNLGRTKVPLYVQVMDPFIPSGEEVADTRELRRIMQDGLELTWDAYRRDYGEFPAGATWVPARLGGGAPTLEETQAEDNRVEQERHRIRQLAEDLTRLNERVKDVTHNLVDGAYAAYGSAIGKLTGGAEGESSRASSVARDLDHVAEWTAKNLEELAASAVTGVKEGADRVAQAASELRANTASLYTHLSTSRWEGYDRSAVEEVLTRITAQARQILDHLPDAVRRRNPQEVKAIALDIEGTLVDPRTHLVGRQSLEALAAFHAAGYPIALVGEAPADELDEIAGQLGFPVDIVAAGGALSYRLVGGSREAVTLHGGFTKAQAAAIEAIVADVDEQLQVTWHRAPAASDAGVVNPAAPGDTVCGVVRTTRSGVDKRAIFEALESPLADEAVLSMGTAPDAVYLSPRGITKIAGLRAWWDSRDVAAENVLYAGDSVGDGPILEAVGMGVTVANADSEAVRAASVTTAPVEEDGVGSFLRELAQELEVLAVDDAQDGAPDGIAGERG